MYALRDVTATVESLPLISASIMSKKLAEDLDGLVLDVKFGSGAFMKSLEQARELALSLQGIGKGAGVNVTALITNMNQPLGAFIGNSLETFECLEILRGQKLINSEGIDLYEDVRSLSLDLAAHMIFLGGRAESLTGARSLAEDALFSGKAYQTFEAVCRAQGGRIEALPTASVTRQVLAPKTGYVAAFAGEAIGMLAIKIGAGRRNVTDTIVPTAGFKIHAKVGDRIDEGSPLWTIYAESEDAINSIETDLLTTVTISSEKPDRLKLIHEVIF